MSVIVFAMLLKRVCIPCIIRVWATEKHVGPVQVTVVVDGVPVLMEIVTTGASLSVMGE